MLARVDDDDANEVEYEPIISLHFDIVSRVYLGRTVLTTASISIVPSYRLPSNVLIILLIVSSTCTFCPVWSFVALNFPFFLYFNKEFLAFTLNTVHLSSTKFLKTSLSTVKLNLYSISPSVSPPPGLNICLIKLYWLPSCSASCAEALSSYEKPSSPNVVSTVLSFIIIFTGRTISSSTYLPITSFASSSVIPPSPVPTIVTPLSVTLSLFFSFEVIPIIDATPIITTHPIIKTPAKTLFFKPIICT